MNGTLTPSKICPLLIENASLHSFVTFLNFIIAYFSVLASVILFPFGIIGNILSLVLLFIQRKNDKYDGIIHYYQIIFGMDLIVSIITVPNELTVFGFNILLDIKLWNLQTIMPYCKFLK